jgi:polyphenol oxidase
MSPFFLPGPLTPQVTWPARVQACFTTRDGGGSLPPFDSFNLGDHVGDDPVCVAANREALADRLGVRPVFLRQVHGLQVLHLDADTPDGAVADACWTEHAGLACTVMVADCLPILLSSADGSSVAAVHAGWRGLAGQGGRGIVEALFEAWPAAVTAGDRAKLVAWLGPCIGTEAFEVGAEVHAAFVSGDPHAAAAFRPTSPGPGGEPKFLADLALLARQRLQAAGLTRIHGNDSGRDWCTVARADLFFSHRRDAARLGSTGRMAACIWKA